MRLDVVLDSFYLLSSLSGAPVNSQVCSVALNALPATMHEIVLAPLLGPSQVTAFVNVNVVPMDAERVLLGQTVLVEGGRIARTALPLYVT